MDYKKFNKGITLIELIIVIAIIGIFSAVAIPKTVSYINSANASAIQVTASQITSCTEKFTQQNLSIVNYYRNNRGLETDDAINLLISDFYLTNNVNNIPLTATDNFENYVFEYTGNNNFTIIPYTIGVETPYNTFAINATMGTNGSNVNFEVYTNSKNNQQLHFINGVQQ